MHSSGYCKEWCFNTGCDLNISGLSSRFDYIGALILPIYPVDTLYHNQKFY